MQIRLAETRPPTATQLNQLRGIETQRVHDQLYVKHGITLAQLSAWQEHFNLSSDPEVKLLANNLKQEILSYMTKAKDLETLPAEA